LSYYAPARSELTVTIEEAPPPPGKPRGRLESYSFPSDATVGEGKDWLIKVHNSGDADGLIAAGIHSEAGNPGSIIVTSGGSEYTVPPGNTLYLFQQTPTPVCTSITQQGTVSFPSEGDYAIKLIGAHREDESWVDDTSESLTTTVTAPPPPPEKSKLTLTVQDALTAQPITGASATLNSAKATTGSDGKATLTDLDPKSYTLTVSAPRYQTHTATVNLAPAGDYTLTVKLTISLGEWWRSLPTWQKALLAASGVGVVIAALRPRR
jgi:hypothetical protein